MRHGLLAASIVAGCLAVSAPAEDAVAEGSPEYLAQKAELEALTSKRDLELFEVNFDPVKMDRLVLTDPKGGKSVAHYLVFRVRNQIGSSGTPISQAKGYNDVLAAVAAQYEQAKITKGRGVALAVEATDGLIIERRDARTDTRSLDLGALAYNEHGTRSKRGVEDSKTLGSFGFPDLGEPVQAVTDGEVRDRVEELLHRRLLTTDEIRGRKLPPYDATKLGEYGWADGELYGIFVFRGLSESARRLTIQVRGLSNKFRESWKATEPGQVENFATSRFLRRQVVLRYDHLGDEYFRDQDNFALVSEGWHWIPTFQRQSQRRLMAYTRHWLNHINGSTGNGLDKEVEQEFWTAYESSRSAAKAHPLPDLKAELPR